MTKLNRAQRVALKRLYDRGPLDELGRSVSHKQSVWRTVKPITYAAFRRTVKPYIGGDCVMVPWCGMWIGIEQDGLTHS